MGEFVVFVVYFPIPLQPILSVSDSSINFMQPLQGLFQQFIACNDHIQSPAFFQSVFKFYTFLLKFSTVLPFLTFFLPFLCCFSEKSHACPHVLEQALLLQKHSHCTYATATISYNFLNSSKLFWIIPTHNTFSLLFCGLCSPYPVSVSYILPSCHKTDQANFSSAPFQIILL